VLVIYILFTVTVSIVLLNAVQRNAAHTRITPSLLRCTLGSP